jgi:hypothetical protein
MRPAGGAVGRSCGIIAANRRPQGRTPKRHVTMTLNPARRTVAASVHRAVTRRLPA